MRIKRISLYVVAVLILALTYVVSNTEAASKYAAEVNGVKIENITVETAVNNVIENQKQSGATLGEEDKGKLRENILQELIVTELLYQESKKAELGNLDAEAEQQFENVKKGFSSEDELEKILKDRGMTEKDLREDIKKRVCIEAFLSKNVYSKITVTEEEKRQEYEKNKDKLDVPDQVKASHILITVAADASDKDKEEAKKRANELRKTARSGEDFAELAKEHSECPSAARGGDLGYFKKGDMVEPFEKAVFSLKEGEISEVVETQFGYHIIKLVEKQSAHTLSYDEVEDNMERFLLNQRSMEETNKFVNSLKDKAEIEIYEQ